MGVQKTILKEGTGEIPKVGDTVTIQYTGWLKDATKQGEAQKTEPPFDTSKDRGDFVVQIGVGQVIKGWDEGVTTMKVGEKALLDISSDYAYGARGFHPVIPPHSTLLFEVELLKVTSD